jgi:hypothetical protein
MEILKPSGYSFEDNVISGIEKLNAFYSVLKNPNTKYFWDLDQVLVDSAKTIFENFNNKNPYGITANMWESDKYYYLTSLVEKAGFKDHGDLEADWIKNIPLYSSESFEYAKSALKIAIDVSGPENNFILTSRLPRLERATSLWVKRELPYFDMNNILIRKKNDLRDGNVFKVDNLKEHSGEDYHVVLIEDQERYIAAALQSDIKNMLIIGMPEGLVSYNICDERLLVLSRFPVKEQEVMPLYTLFQNAQRQ